MRDSGREFFYLPWMANSKRKRPAPEEQDILDHCQVRLLIHPDDVARCDERIVEEHYLHDATLVGEHLRYAVTYRGEWLAVATWSACAFHLKARDEFIGWSAEQCRRRRPLLANNARLLVLPQCHYPNLVSRFMKLMLGRLSADWQEYWSHPIVMVETFVDPQFFQGTAYKVSGWSHLGRTAGWKRDAADFYLKHETPKQIWVRELTKNARAKLRATTLPADWARGELELTPRCRFKTKEIQSLMELLLQEVPEFRRPQSLAYPVAGLVALVLMALATGVRKGPDDLAKYADTLSAGQLRALRFRSAVGHVRRVRCPKKTVFHTLLNQVDADLLERVLLLWQNQILGPTQDRLLIVDGKKMRHGAVEMVNMVAGSGRFLGAMITPDKSSEVCAARQLLRTQDLSGRIVVADALHTNVETAQQILYEQGGDFLLTVKGNQPTVEKTLAALFADRAFSPSGHVQDPHHAGGKEPQPR